MFCGAENRVLRRLADLAERLGEGTDEVVVSIRQEDLAVMAGTSRSTVNRTLKREAARGTVRLQRGQIVVRDVQGFRRLVGAPLLTGVLPV